MTNEEKESAEMERYIVLIWKRCENIAFEKKYKLSISYDDYEVIIDGINHKFMKLREIYLFLLSATEVLQ
jgi:hypothetical protein